MNVSLRGPCVLRLVRNLKGSCDAKGLVVGSIAYRQAQTRYFNLVIVGTILYIYAKRDMSSNTLLLNNCKPCIFIYSSIIVLSKFLY